MDLGYEQMKKRLEELDGCFSESQFVKDVAGNGICPSRFGMKNAFYCGVGCERCWTEVLAEKEKVT